MYADAHKFTTVPLFLSAAAEFGRQRWGANYRLPRAAAFNAAFTGMRHYYGPATVSSPKAALTLSDLGAIAPHLDIACYDDARDWCAFLFAFFGLLRINEYAGGGLRHCHVRVTADGVDITILSSKTMQHPVTVSIALRRAVGVLDGTHCQIEVPVVEDSQYHSQYKNFPTRNYLICADALGFVIYTAEPFSGRGTIGQPSALPPSLKLSVLCCLRVR